MHYMLFVPNALVPAERGNAKKILTHNGMEDLADGAPATGEVVGAGPDGGPGVMIGWGKAEPCKPAEQDWTKMPSGVWLGVWKDKPPTAEEMKREKASPGQWVTMGDGNSYLVPVARLGPRKMEFDEGGNLVQVRTGKLGEIFEFCEQVVFPKWLGQPHIEPDWIEVSRFVARLLGLNYRLTLEIAVVLDLLDNETMLEACKATVELAVIMEFLKTEEGQQVLQKKSEAPA